MIRGNRAWRRMVSDAVGDDMVAVRAPGRDGEGRMVPNRTVTYSADPAAVTNPNSRVAAAALRCLLNSGESELSGL